MTNKEIYNLTIDQEFRSLIRPLFKNEYMQLEANLIADGCREPIAIWNGVIVDGHNRYKICTQHSIPFAVEEMSFSCREEAISWICTNQLGRRNLTEESRKYLIGKQYESEKKLSRKRANIQPSGSVPQEYNSPDDVLKKPGSIMETKQKTADRIAMDNHISHGTVEKYSLYARALEEIEKKVPQITQKILSGEYKVSHDAVLTLAEWNHEPLQDLNQRLEKGESSFVKYQTTRHEIRDLTIKARGIKNSRPSIKDMPEFDPDAEVTGLTLTIPSWSSSVDRVTQSNLEIISESARQKLNKALEDLRDSVSLLLSAIKEGHNGSIQ